MTQVKNTSVRTNLRPPTGCQGLDFPDQRGEAHQSHRVNEERRHPHPHHQLHRSRLACSALRLNERGSDLVYACPSLSQVVEDGGAPDFSGQHDQPYSPASWEHGNFFLRHGGSWAHQRGVHGQLQFSQQFWAVRRHLHFATIHGTQRQHIEITGHDGCGNSGTTFSAHSSGCCLNCKLPPSQRPEESRRRPLRQLRKG